MNIVNEALNASAVSDFTASVLKNAKNIQGIAKIAQRKSIMTMAQPGMYQYPLVASSAIDTETLMSIAKSYQLTYASNVVTAYSLNPIMYTKETPEISDFVKKFHTNSDSILDANLTSAGKAVGVESDNELPEGCDISVESATVSNKFTPEDYVALNSTVWDDCHDYITMESLNDMYRPYDRIHRIMTEKLNSMKTANESIGDVLNDINKSINSDDNYSTQVPIGTQKSSSSEVKYDKYGNVTSSKVLDKNGGTLIRNFKNEIVRNSQLDNMEPTMVNVQIVSHGDGVQQTHNLTLGIKVVSRVISSDLMIASMVEACKQSQSIFKFLKWTKGEVKTLDFILGISAAKSKAIEKNAKQEVKFLKQSAERKKQSGLISKFLKNEKLPTMSVVLTTYEVERIKEATNIDLNNFAQAMKLLKKYFLLSIAIYDPDQNTVKFLFDCDNDWGIISVGTMKTAVNKTNDILNANEIFKMTGRR